ncbi:helix-turn-helix domain-containing protein [Streptomyces mayteni]
MTTRRQEFGAYLARLRRAGRRSQRQLAERLCALSGVTSLTRNEVSRWERGERIPDSWLPFLAQAVGVPLDELERAAARARGEPDAPATLPGPPHTGQHADRAAVDSFRMADRQLGGGHLYGAVLHYLTAEVAPRLFGAASVSSTPETFRAAAALTEMAGWMAHDSGRDDRAQQHFAHALPLARAGSDGALAANILASMSHLALDEVKSTPALSSRR